MLFNWIADLLIEGGNDSLQICDAEWAFPGWGVYPRYYRIPRKVDLDNPVI